MKDPKTKTEWRDAVDAAHGALTLDASRQYGLVEGGPEVNVKRCSQIIEKGRRRGILPSKDAVERYINGLVANEKRT